MTFPRLPNDSHHDGFPASLSELHLIRGISGKGRHETWSKTSCIRRLREACIGGQVQELLCLRSIIGEGPILQISNDRIPLTWRGIKAKASPISRWTLGLAMHSMGISRVNWNSVAAPKLASESA